MINVLRLIAAYFAEKGIETIAPDRFLPGRKMPLGVVHNGISADQGAISPEGTELLLTEFQYLPLLALMTLASR